MANSAVNNTTSLNARQSSEGDVVLSPSTAGCLVAEVEETCKPQDSLFESLPDEILLNIFDALAAEANKAIGRQSVNKVITNVSLVCKRFWHAVVNTASFWTKIDHPYCQKAGFEARLMRAGNAPLLIDMSGIENMVPAAREEGLNRMLQLGDRWGHLRVHFGNLGWEDIVRNFSGREFPLVETAYIRFTPFDTVDPFFNEWKFPNLVALRTHSAIPPLAMFRDLAELNISINRTWLYQQQHHERLLESLACVPRLERLSLHLAGGLREIGSPIPLRLPSLTFLSISNYYDPTATSQSEGSAMHVVHFLESLQMPMLQDLHVALVFPDKQRLRNWLNCEQRIGEILFAATEVTIITEFRLERNPLRRLVAMFSNVRVLRLDTVKTLETLKSLGCCFWLSNLESFQTVRWPGESKARFKTEDMRIFSDDASNIRLSILEPKSRRERHPFAMSTK